MKKDMIEQLIEEDNGYLIISKAVDVGIFKPSISKYVKDHDMEKVAHGIYILDDVWPNEFNKEVHYAKGDTLQMGAYEVTFSSGNLVRAYDKKRCICDMIREWKKYDVQVFQTAMKEYMASKDKNVSLLVEYAVKLDIRDKVMMYVEVLV